MEKLQHIAPPIGRVLMSIIFIMAGIGKIFGYAGTQGYMESFGIPGILLPLVILLELGGGIALLLGFKTRLIAFLLGGFTLIAGIIFHLPAAGGDQTQMIMFMKNLAITGGLGYVFAFGAGAYALDNR